MVNGRLDKFSSLEYLSIRQCQVSSFLDLDMLLDKIPSPNFHTLYITDFDSKSWCGSLQDIKPHKSMKNLYIEKMIIGDFSLQYLANKFPDLGILEIQSLQYDNDSEEKEELYWNHINQLFLTRAEVYITLGFGTFGVETRVGKGIQVLRNIKFCWNDELSITILDPPIKGEKLNEQPSITLKNMDGNLECDFRVLRTDTHLVIKYLFSWLYAYRPRIVLFHGIEKIPAIYQYFTNHSQHIKPFFDINNPSDIKYFLSKCYNRKGWMFIHYSYLRSACHLKNIILSGPLPKDMLKQVRKGCLNYMSFVASIIHHKALPRISKKVHEIKLLTFTSTLILMDKPFTLKVFLPSTKIHKLGLNLAPLLKGTDLKDQDDLLARCTLENQELLAAISPTGHYTLKIETESKTRISRRQGNDSQILDMNPEDVTCGSKNDFLIWIKCKELELFSIKRDDSTVDDYLTFDDEEFL